MDFLDFKNHDLYFDETMSEDDEALLKKAASLYPAKEAEIILQEMKSRLPENLTVIVALYRFYYYQHQYQEALYEASRALNVSAKKMGLHVGWRRLTQTHMGQSVFISMGLTRFYMLSLKASAYLLMRMGNIDQAYERLKKIAELDPGDQFGSAMLYRIAQRELSARFAARHNVESLICRQNH